MKIIRTEHLYLLLFISTLFAFGSCGENSPVKRAEVETSDNDVIKEESDIDNTTHTFSDNDTELLEGLPYEWILLTQIDDRLVIYEYCDAGTPAVSITQENGKYMIRFFYGQESSVSEILSCAKKTSDPTDTYQESYDFKIKDIDSGDITVLSLIYNVEAGTGKWVWLDFFDENMLFARHDKSVDYELVIQPCTDCWDEAMCNEGEFDFASSYGIGVAHVILSDHTELQFYTNQEDPEPKYTIVLNMNDYQEFEWLQPLDYFVDYGIFYLACNEVSDDMYKVLTDQENHISMWLKINESVEFNNYGEYLAKTLCVQRIDGNKNPIRSEADDNASLVDGDHEEMFFTVLNHKDMWILVETNTDMESDFQIVKGWIKWRDSQDFLVSKSWVM